MPPNVNPKLFPFSGIHDKADAIRAVSYTINNPDMASVRSYKNISPLLFHKKYCQY